MPNPMQQMLAQANRMQRELAKAQADLAKETFSVEKGGMVKIEMSGDKKLTKIEIDDEAMDKDNKEMVSDALIMAINEAIETISKKEDEIEERITGRSGFPF